MTAGGGYELVLTPPARRALTGKLPEAVASAVIDHRSDPRAIPGGKAVAR